jgi:hypothetical protein
MILDPEDEAFNEIERQAKQRKEAVLQALHSENERLGLYKDAYGQQEPVALTDDEIYDAAFSAYCRGENTRELFRIMWGNRLTCSIGWDRDELKAFARNIAYAMKDRIDKFLQGEDYRAMYLKVRDELSELQQRTWVGLTDADIAMWRPRFKFSEALIREVEAKLKEKNNA